jgi:hypothetical protein
MWNKIILCCFLLIMNFSFVASQEKQDSLRVKTNSILFAGINLGYANGGLKGIHVSFDINYQFKSSLFTLKYAAITGIKAGIFFLTPFRQLNSSTEEVSLLYGKRYVVNGFSYHFSGGISYANTKGAIFDKTYNYFGFPIEIGANWFQSKKKRLSILYGLIPFGKPMGLGNSFGFKLHANIARKSYIGISCNFGLGWHKKYK